MRASYNNAFLLDNDRLIGLSFGADYCAEHEWGIKETYRKLGVDSTKQGIAKYMITQLNLEHFHWVEGSIKPTDKRKKAVTVAGFSFSYYKPENISELCQQMGSNFRYSLGTKEEDVSTAWSDGEFAAVAIGATNIGYLRELHSYILARNAVVFLGGGGVFQNAGLSICIADRISNDIKTMWLETHQAQDKLTSDFAATGIEKYLTEHNKRWFCLSPRRQGDGSIKVWLNPYEQSIHRYGWYDIEELREWAHNRGPVMK